MNCPNCNSNRTQFLGSIFWPTNGPERYHCEACGISFQLGDSGLETQPPPSVEESLEEIVKVLRDIRDQGKPESPAGPKRLSGYNLNPHFPRSS